MLASLLSRAQADERYDVRQRRIVGPFLIGTIVQAFLVGNLCCQYWTLLTRVKARPSFSLHVFLFFLVALNVSNEGVTFAHIWHLIVDYLAQPRQTFNYRSPASVGVICHYNVIIHMCSFFFAKRCYIVTGRRQVIAWLLGGLFSASAGMSLATCAVNIYVVTRGQSFVETRLFLTIALGLQAGLDLTVSAILVAKIEKHELRRVRAVVQKVIMYSLTTASLTAALSIVEAFVLMLYWRKTSAYAAIGLVMPSISSISVIAALRARDSLSAAIKSHETPSEVLSAFHNATERRDAVSHNSSGGTQVVFIVVDRTRSQSAASSGY
ncbi:hypothetical protein P389DRAFT_102108 [Cystobasidium minutum MCA 4210]|uniref:uncharacterized protein n=1 Tax=Cystobasidium minutum MCA 4210 TaxID=1397322 RepID=UPI0034CE0F9A|eukprot:jgi/Rhomi1/102108/CE102107_404